MGERGAVTQKAVALESGLQQRVLFGRPEEAEFGGYAGEVLAMAGDKQGDPSLRRIVRSERKAAVYHLAGATTSKADPSPPFANDGRPDSG